MPKAATGDGDSGGDGDGESKTDDAEGAALLVPDATPTSR